VELFRIRAAEPSATARAGFCPVDDTLIGHSASRGRGPWRGQASHRGYFA
jgi:hypothetical protein